MFDDRCEVKQLLVTSRCTASKNGQPLDTVSNVVKRAWVFIVGCLLLREVL